MLSSAKPTIHLPDLLEGEVDTGYGIRLAPVFSSGKRKRLVALRMSHDIHEYGEGVSGVCSKIIPIRQARLRKGRYPRRSLNATHWSLYLDNDKTITLQPSIACKQHSIHGYIRDGAWAPMRVWAFEHLTEEQYQRRIQVAEDLIREYGGGYEGAVLALASRSYVGPLYGALHVTRPLETKNPA